MFVSYRQESEVMKSSNLDQQLKSTVSELKQKQQENADNEQVEFALYIHCMLNMQSSVSLSGPRKFLRDVRLLADMAACRAEQLLALIICT